MQATETTTSRLSIRLPQHIKDEIEEAALVSGVSVTDFTISSLAISAEQVLERHRLRRLTNRDRDIFLAMLDSDTEPNEKLIDAFKAMKELIAE
ncbi:MAG TPA: DUF1778 domain-containing protein [Pyrinomonadaceae bacterium]|nr:DUF1778 domain-containing protein [Acidobacteriota bacterium]HQZ94793.1 DUF1778 domain-containing protein [Pyrinomonadaceae bacterium]